MRFSVLIAVALLGPGILLSGCTTTQPPQQYREISGPAAPMVIKLAREHLDRGELDIAERALHLALVIAPDTDKATHGAANYYLSLIAEARYSARRRAEEVRRGTWEFRYPSMPPIPPQGPI